jgi:hypothetical protein
MEYAVIGFDGYINYGRFSLDPNKGKIAILYRPNINSNWYFLTRTNRCSIRAHEKLCTIAIGLIHLPVYVIMWISDFVVETNILTAYQKLRLIEGVRISIKRIVDNRSEPIIICTNE